MIEHIKIKNYFFKGLILLLVCFISFFLYEIVFINYKGYYMMSLASLISQIILETNILFIIFWTYLYLYYTTQENKLNTLLYLPILYILLFLVSLYFFNNNNGNTTNILIVLCFQIALISLLSKKFKVKYKLNLIPFIFTGSLVVILSCIICYYNLMTLNKNCMIAVQKNEMISCLNQLDYKQVSFYKSSINGSNIVKIFNKNPAFKKEAEEFIHAKAHIEGNHIEWVND